MLQCRLLYSVKNRGAVRWEWRSHTFLRYSNVTWWFRLHHKWLRSHRCACDAQIRTASQTSTAK